MKNVIITGGTRGIGAACVRKFLSAGDKVAFLYKSSDKEALLIKEEFPNVLPVKADVTKEEEIKKAFSLIFSDFGEPDVLVNNAGISFTALLQDMSLSDWNEVISTNLTSAFLTSREVLPSMIRRKKGVIINISSMWGVSGASLEVAYSASKAGLIGFTKALAMELAPSSVRVNAVAPGVIKTDMLSQYTESDLSLLSEETPLNRLGTSEDIANAVYFLSSENADFITGEVLNVNGGFIV